MGDTEKELEKPLQESIEEPLEKSKEETSSKVKELLEKHKKLLMGGLLLLCTFLVIYIGMALYFMKHFYIGTNINGISVAGKTVEDAKEIITEELRGYTLSIKERGGKIEQIKATDIGLRYSSNEDLEDIKESQGGFRWLSAFLNTEYLNQKVIFTYDERLLKERINQLTCFDPSNIIEPKNPSFKYVDNRYVIVKEIMGNRVDKDILYDQAATAIRKGASVLDLELKNCYVRPKFNSKSPIIIETKDTLNKYVATQITYSYGNINKNLDGTQINQWLIIDKNYKVTVNEAKVKAYVKELAKTYNTVGRSRSFVTSTGKTIKISGGDYGRAIDRTKETQYLISAIKASNNMIKEPVFKQTAFAHDSNDIGKTYVEISIGNQHLWYYKNGSLIAHGPVVTGNVSRHFSTRKGVFSLKYIARNVVLRGPDYAAPVAYWMPFDGGIGIHDASWRSVFGGNIYRFNGSHGCVNSPHYLAKKIYNNITPGTPVIVY